MQFNKRIYFLIKTYEKYNNILRQIKREKMKRNILNGSVIVLMILVLVSCEDYQLIEPNI